MPFDSVATTERQQLRLAVRHCRERGLYEAAKWAAVQLNGLRPDPEGATPANDPSPTDDPNLTSAEDDAHHLALAHFDVREYRSAAHVLQGCRSTSEERKERASLAAYASSNKELDALLTELQDMQEAHTADGFLLYLLGVVLVDKDSLEEAHAALVAAVTAYPCNWVAWKALQAACPDYAAAAELKLPDHFASKFFAASICLDTQRNAEALEALRVLNERFPRSQTLSLAVASAHNNLHNYDQAQEIYQDLLHTDPHRLEGMDTLSNILYVKEDAVNLAHLAQRCAEQDRYRPESCCVVGNYYSLRGQHEKAVVYFRRALRLDPTYLPAWTLMGHEYVELKNPPAAIEAYRRAVDVNPRDYRAWYGLGQTYELVNMPHYALHYYRRAVALRPADARMWIAMGHCYASSSLGQTDAAIRCLQRALPHDREGVALRQLGMLHAAQGHQEEAAHFHKINLDRMEAEGLVAHTDAVEAVTFLAQYHREKGELLQAEEYYTRLLDYGAMHHQEQAKSSLRQIREELARGAGGSGGGASPGSDMGITPPR